MFMRTPRLFLRPVFAEDWRAIFNGMNDEALVRMLARAPWPYREEDARAFCDTRRDARDLRMAITVPTAQGAPLIGMIGMDTSDAVPEIGYWIARDHRGKGYASEALNGILAMARAIGVSRVQAGHYLDNPASGAVLRKCGFAETGEIQPTHALGRGGEMVLARRYARELAPVGAGLPGEMRKPA